MAKRRLSNLPFEFQDEETPEITSLDAADEAFWDEFWHAEVSQHGEPPLVTITLRDEETGEERVIEKVRLRFRSSQKIAD